MSVPNQCSLEGCLRRWTGESACGSAVASHGARIAMTTMATSTNAPTMAVGCRRNASRKRRQVGELDRGAAITGVFMSVTDPRVKQTVRQINRQIDEHIDS